MRRNLILVLLLIVSFPMILSAQIESEIRLPDAPEGLVREFSVAVRNPGPEAADYSFLSTCSCLSPRESQLRLEAGERGTLLFRFDTSGLVGEAERMLVYTRRADSSEMGRIKVSLKVLPSSDEEFSASRSDPDSVEVLEGESLLTADFYADASCSECAAFLERLPQGLRLIEHDILDPAVMDELLLRLEELEAPLDEFPLMIIDGRILQGLDAIERRLPALLRGDASSEPAASSPGESWRSFSIAAVLLAGLADGVNPCAFSTILFLVSMLALTGRSRRQILLVGGVFTVTVFTGYFAAGLGLFAAVRTLFVFPILVRAVRWLLILGLLLLAVLSLRDAWLARRGRTGEMSLQLSKEMKRRIHGVVRSRLRSGSLILGTVALGLLVTIFEFSCTGQVYLPVIMHLARNEADLRAYLLLAGYNLAFILPLVLVFGVSYAGVSLPKISDFFSRRVALVKLILAGVFLAMAILTVLT